MNTVTASRRMTAASLAMHLSPEVTKRPAPGLLRLLRGMVGWIAAFLDGRAARRQLYEMSDYQLSDIGLSRGQIDHVFDQGFQNFKQAANVPHYAASGLEAQTRAELS